AKVAVERQHSLLAQLGGKGGGGGLSRGNALRAQPSFQLGDDVGRRVHRLVPQRMGLKRNVWSASGAGGCPARIFRPADNRASILEKRRKNDLIKWCEWQGRVAVR